MTIEKDVMLLMVIEMSTSAIYHWFVILIVDAIDGKSDTKKLVISRKIDCSIASLTTKTVFWMLIFNNGIWNGLSRWISIIGYDINNIIQRQFLRCINADVESFLDSIVKLFGVLSLLDNSWLKGVFVIWTSWLHCNAVILSNLERVFMAWLHEDCLLPRVLPPFLDFGISLDGNKDRDRCNC